MITRIPHLIRCLINVKGEIFVIMSASRREMANLAVSYSGMNLKTGKIGCARPGPRATMAAMGWRTTGDVAEFLAAAGEYLWREPASNTVILTVSEQLRLTPARYQASGGGDPEAVLARRPLLGWWTDQAGATGGAFLHTPPHPLLLTAVPAAVAADLAVALAGRPLGGVNGYVEAAEAFAATWRAATPGGRATQERRLRLYRLGELAWPDPAPDGAPPRRRGRRRAAACRLVRRVRRRGP
jgi:hypothetical protein